MPLKYDYSHLRQHVIALAIAGVVTIDKLRVFYPRASFTELGAVLSATNGLDYNPLTHVINVTEMVGE